MVRLDTMLGCLLALSLNLWLFRLRLIALQSAHNITRAGHRTHQHSVIAETFNAWSHAKKLTSSVFVTNLKEPGNSQSPEGFPREARHATTAQAVNPQPGIPSATQETRCQLERKFEQHLHILLNRLN